MVDGGYRTHERTQKCIQSISRKPEVNRRVRSVRNPVPRASAFTDDIRLPGYACVTQIRLSVVTKLYWSQCRCCEEEQHMVGTKHRYDLHQTVAPVECPSIILQTTMGHSANNTEWEDNIIIHGDRPPEHIRIIERIGLLLSLSSSVPLLLLRQTNNWRSRLEPWA
jgi:hypothetical protein